MTIVLRRARGPLGLVETSQPAPAKAAALTTPTTDSRPARAAPTTHAATRRWRTAKRLLDLVLGTMALVVVLPLLIAAALAIALESPGGCLYRQTRVGRDGRPFTLCKLRTMAVGNDDTAHTAYVDALIDGSAAPSHGGIYKLAGDPRCTRLGRWLRVLSIDELPQLLNVIGGQMSLVGPRPATPAEAARWDARTRGRLAVKPGMTGLWQVSGRSRITFDRMVDLDLEYVERGNPVLDLGILLRTPVAVLRRETA